MTNNRKTLSLLCAVLILNVTACAHQSKVQPSNGHIDGQASASGVDAKSAKGAAIPANIPKPVTNSTYLPPPKPKAKEPVYSIVVYDTPVKEVLFAIARDSKLNVDIHPAIQGNVTLNAVDQTLPAILERIAKQVDLTYSIKSNVLTIVPDQPVLRTYKVDYVNMSRDTNGFIGAATQIASTGQAASTGQSNASSGNLSNNSSRTSVSSESKNSFWDSLERNIKELLAETDKEVMITRTGSRVTPVKTTSKDDPKSGQPVTQMETLGQDNVQDEFKTLFAANVISNREAGIISVRATSKQHEKVQEFLDKVLSSAKRQVLIEATIVEVQLSDGFQAGIDWSRLGNAGAGNGVTFSQRLNSANFEPGSLSARATGDGIVAGYFNPASAWGNIAASVNLLKQFGETKVLSSPKLMVLNNQTAVLKVVNNLVYFTVKSEITGNIPNGNGGVVQGIRAITTTPHTVPVGVVMSVTPQINDKNVVNLNVRPTISRSVGTGVPDPNPDLGVPSVIPEIEVREMESMLQINSGSTAVLGGLMQDEIRHNSDRVPGLSKLPIIGGIFKGRDDSNKKTELVIFLRPTVITNASLESDELSTYQQYLPTPQLEKTLDNDSER